MKDHEWSDKPTCPYCGHTRDPGDVDIPQLEGTAELECGKCEKEFKVTQHVIFRFSSEAAGAK